MNLSPKQIWNNIVVGLGKQIAESMDTKANPAGGFSVGDDRDGVQHRPNDIQSFKNVLKFEVWAYVAITTIGKSLSGAPLIAEKRETVDGELRWVKHEEGDLSDLITRPNEQEPIDIIVWRLIMSLLSTGDGYLVFDDVNNYIYCVDPGIVHVVADGNGVKGYKIGPALEAKFFEPDQVVHVKMPNPNNAFYGMSPMEPIKKHIMINNNYLSQINATLRDGGIPAGFLVTKGQMAQDEIDKTLSIWKSRFGGVNAIDKIAVLHGGMDFKTVSPPIGEMIIESLNRMTREAILATFGMPPVLGGVFEFANYANSREQIRIFWENTILPLQRLIAGYLNIQLVPRFGDDLRVRFDTSKIPALQQDEDKRATRLSTYVKSRIMTPNEARLELGLESHDDGDELTPMNAFPKENEDENKGLGLPSSAPNGKSSACQCGRSDSTRDEQWEIHHKSVASLEKTMIKIMRKYFDGQIDRLLKELKEITFGGKQFIGSLLYSWLRQTKGPEEDATTIFNIEAENLVLIAAVEEFINKVVKDSGNAALARVGVSLDFNVKNPAVQALVESFNNRIKTINDTSYEEIKKILQGVFDESAGLPVAEKRLRNKFKEFSKVRAKRIALTEMNGMVNGASVQAYKDAEVTKKQWFSAFLPDTRMAHADADSQIVSIGEAFVVDGEFLKFPGDPNGSVGNIVNCHCDVSPVLDDD